MWSYIVKTKYYILYNLVGDSIEANSDDYHFFDFYKAWVGKVSTTADDLLLKIFGGGLPILKEVI